MPSNPKRPGPGRTGNGTTTPEATIPTDASANPEQPKAAPPLTPPAPPAQQRLNITDLKDMSIQKLTQIAKDLAVGGATGMRKQELIFQILQAQTEQSGFIFSRRRARNAARRLRLPALARLQLPAGPRRHLRLAVADSQVRSADRRHRLRARSGRPRKANATSRCSRSRRSTSRSPIRRARSCSSTT